MGIFKSVGTVLSEIWTNKVRLFRLALYELKSQHGGTFFGFLWNFMNVKFSFQSGVYSVTFKSKT